MNRDMEQRKNLKYADAIRELEEIVNEIEEGSVTVDILAEKVKRATELIRICKAKLTSTEDEVKKILEELGE